jgi:predicted Fe-Mo cluster-binding NifX family protein
MKIAFTTKGISWDSLIDPRFGRTEYVLIYDEDTKELSYHDNREIENTVHGAGPQTAKLIFDINPDVLITGNGPGGNAAKVLEKSSLVIYIGAGELTAERAYELYRLGELSKF